MKLNLTFLIFISILIFPSTSFAGGAVAKRQQGQAQMMQQRAIQEKAVMQQQMMMRQQQMMQQQAIQQQAVMQQRAMMQQQAVGQQKAAIQQQAVMQQRAAMQQAVQQKAMVEQGAVRQQVQGAQQSAVQQALEERMQQQTYAVQQAVERKARQEATNVAQNNALMQGRAVLQSQAAVYTGAAAIQQNLQMNGQLSLSEDIDESQVQDVVPLGELWKAFEHTSVDWPLIMEMKAKLLVVQKFIEDYRQQGIIINKPALSYSSMLDSLSQENPDLLKQPFPQLLRFMAIVEYDFNNGVDKDRMAKQVLGEKAFEANRRRLGL